VGHLLTGLVDAVGFLTRLPVGAEVHDSSRISRAVPWFPVVGALVGALVAGVYASLLYVLPPLVAAVIAVAAGMLVTGAFHEDGLADLADAFGGGRDRDDRLRILKDPRLGTFGVLAVVVSALVRVGSIAALGQNTGLLVIPSAHALGRAAAVGTMLAFDPVTEGLGASYVRAVRRRQAVIGIVAGVLIAAALMRAWAAIGIVIGTCAAAALGRLASRKIGGINGDVLGAVEQVTEIGVLVLAVAALHHGRLV